MIFNHINMADHEDTGKIKEALLENFSMDAFQAYDVFRTRVWLNEPVDVFSADIVRLDAIRFAAHSWDEETH